jgi:ABC-type iron transport system FetAB ATPase subunit
VEISYTLLTANMFPWDAEANMITPFQQKKNQTTYNVTVLLNANESSAAPNVMRTN